MSRGRGHRTPLSSRVRRWRDTRATARSRVPRDRGTRRGRNRLYCLVFSGGVMTDSFNARTTLTVGAQKYEMLGLSALRCRNVDRLPYSLQQLRENLLSFDDALHV